MSVDIGNTIAPNSDQLDAVDLLTGPRTFTIKRVSKGSSDEQPVNIHLAEFPRPWRPGKSMRRVLVTVWGTDTTTYVGRRLTLWCDPAVIFGGVAVGGVRITHMSHLDKVQLIPLLISRGKSSPYKVQPLPDDAPDSPVITEATLDELLGLFVRKGIPEDAQLAGVNRIIGGSATDLEVITEAEARQVITALQGRPDVTQTPAPTQEPTEHAKETQAQAAASWGDEG